MLPGHLTLSKINVTKNTLYLGHGFVVSKERYFRANDESMQPATVDMNIFFSPKSRIRTSMTLAHLMNTLNLLGPALLVVAALVIRILWGIGVRLIVRKTVNRRP